MRAGELANAAGVSAQTIRFYERRGLLPAPPRLSSGYRDYPAEVVSTVLPSEFIARERLCCPFFTFELVAEQEDGPLWLHLRGREGVKDFIKIELGVK
jgi:hypothetical protein